MHLPQALTNQTDLFLQPKYLRPVVLNINQLKKQSPDLS